MILIAIFLLFVAAFLLMILGAFQRRIAWYWLTAFLGGWGAWILVLLARLSIPNTISLLTWQLPYDLFQQITLRIDTSSWPYAIAVVTFGPAVLLTAQARHNHLDWRPWAGSLAMSGMGLFAVCAGNPFTLILAWAGLDLTELLIMLVQEEYIGISRNMVLTFAERGLGIGLVSLSVLTVSSGGQTFNLTNIPANAAPYLLLAAWLRLGVLPTNARGLFEDTTIRRGFGTLLRLIPTASGLMLLTRNATIDISKISWTSSDLPIQSLLLMLTIFSALIGAVYWITASNELNGRPFWVFSLSSLVTAAALLGKPEAVLAWGLALLFSGSVIFLYSAHSPLTLFFPILGALAFSAIPFSPLWHATDLYSAKTLLMPFLLTHALLLLGYVQHTLRTRNTIDNTQRWVRTLYIIGLALPVITLYLSGYTISRNDAKQGWWGGALAVLIAIGLAAVGKLANRRDVRFPQTWKPLLWRLFPFDWLYRFWKTADRLMTRWMSLISQILEGEGGLLWILILASMLVTWYLSTGGGFGR